MQYNFSTEMRSTYRARGLDNLLRMGHCAPAVMQTMHDINHCEQEGLVKLMAGMPGGIGNTGFECGGITSPLVILGLRLGLRELHAGLPLIFDQGHAYFQSFSNENAATFCKAIQNPRFPVRCIHAVRHAPELLAETLENEDRSVIPVEQREAYSYMLTCSRMIFIVLMQFFNTWVTLFRSTRNCSMPLPPSWAEHYSRG
jgi:C_GCAxxG_C_C family probable redox protein